MECSIKKKDKDRRTSKLRKQTSVISHLSSCSSGGSESWYNDLPAEKPSHLGRTLVIGNSNAGKCCARLEKSLEPTIVSRDKKAYSVHCTFDSQRNNYRKAIHQVKI